jgi:hypothetical protein
MQRSLAAAMRRILAEKELRPVSQKSTARIFRYFFGLQYQAALFRRIPVSVVDHPLDAAIPFEPGRVKTYLDFVGFWVRSTAFLLDAFGSRGIPRAADFIETMGDLYAFAAVVYRRNMSTTARPFYIRTPRFFLIHLLDPHLMCIPSLHVMVAIRTWTKMRAVLCAQDCPCPAGTPFEGGRYAGRHYADHIARLRERALAITEAVLYVKQHSVNCVSAAMYAMTRFDGALFPPEEAEAFAADMFSDSPTIKKEDVQAIRSHLIALYRSFLETGRNSPHWEDPLLEFLWDSRRQRKHA